jgi:hypothetical protein
MNNNDLNYILNLAKKDFGERDTDKLAEYFLKHSIDSAEENILLFDSSKINISDIKKEFGNSEYYRDIIEDIITTLNPNGSTMGHTLIRVDKFYSMDNAPEFENINIHGVVNGYYYDNYEIRRSFLTKNNIRYYAKIKLIIPNENRLLTLDDIFELLDEKKITKKFLRKIIGQIDLHNSSSDNILKLIEGDKIDAFRIIGKKHQIQLDRDNLLKLVKTEKFNRQTTSGVFGGIETADIVNRRAVILYQNNIDFEIFSEIIDGIKDEYSRKSFLKTLNKKSILNKFNNIDERISLWIKLQ